MVHRLNLPNWKSRSHSTAVTPMIEVPKVAGLSTFVTKLYPVPVILIAVMNSTSDLLEHGSTVTYA